MVTRALGGGTTAAQYLIAKSYLESLTKIADQAQKVVFLPFEASATLSSVGAIKELWKESSARP
jgi:hypothetical protein